MHLGDKKRPFKKKNSGKSKGDNAVHGYLLAIGLVE